MQFSWDERKNRNNRRKHGIGFDTAARVFFDPFSFTRPDQVVAGEERWQTMGTVNGLVIVIAYTVVDEEEDILRIISARRVTRQERIEYEEASGA